ncbi:hypothetical protein ACRRTK_010487 [Alexandromys fortis]
MRIPRPSELLTCSHGVKCKNCLGWRRKRSIVVWLRVSSGDAAKGTPAPEPLRASLRHPAACRPPFPNLSSGRSRRRMNNSLHFGLGLHTVFSGVVHKLQIEFPKGITFWKVEGSLRGMKPREPILD